MIIHEYPNGEEKPQAPQDIAEPTKLVDTSRRSFTKSGLVASGVLLTLASRPVLGGYNGGYNGGGDGYGGRVCQPPSGFCSGNLSHHGTPHDGGGKTCQYWQDNCDSWANYNCDRSKPFCEEFGNFDCNGNYSYGCNVTYYQSNNNYKYYQNSQYSSCTYTRGSTSNWSNTYQWGSASSSSRYVKYTLLDMLCRYHAGHYPSGDNSNCDVIINKYGNCVNTFYTSGYCSNITNYCQINGGNMSAMDYLAQHCVKALLNCRAGYTPFLPETTVKSMFNDCRTKGYFEPTAGVQWSPSQCIDYLKSTEGSCTYYS